MDFSLSISIPLFHRQPGSYFFKIGLGVRIFGINRETTNTQVNFVLPEGCYRALKRGTGKWPNLLISLLH